MTINEEDTFTNDPKTLENSVEMIKMASKLSNHQPTVKNHIRSPLTSGLSYKPTTTSDWCQTDPEIYVNFACDMFMREIESAIADEKDAFKEDRFR